MMRIGKIILSAAFFVALLSMFSLAQAEDQSIGLVLAVQGKVHAQQGKRAKRLLRRRSPIFVQDTITTPADGRVQIRLRDDSILSVRPDTQFTIAAFKFDPKNPKDNQYVGKLLKGALINLSGQGESKNYHLEGPLSTIGFRGTGVIYKLGGEEERVGVFHGGVDIQSGSSKKQREQMQRTGVVSASLAGKIVSAAHDKYTQVSIQPSGRIAFSAGSLLQPTPIPTGSTFVGTGNVQQRLKSLSGVVENRFATIHGMQPQEPHHVAQQSAGASFANPTPDSTVSPSVPEDPEGPRDPDVAY